MIVFFKAIEILNSTFHAQKSNRAMDRKEEEEEEKDGENTLVADHLKSMSYQTCTEEREKV
jgi:hypothetical protein